MEFCKQFNAQTADKGDLIIPVLITVYSDRSFTFILKTPPASVLIRKELGLPKGSAVPNRDKVGKLTAAQVESIAKQKLTDLNTESLEAAKRTIEGTARSMGVDIVRN
jgi:large subunit ribosomal protein L11